MVFYLPYNSIRHIKLDERKIVILNQGIENYITDELLEIDYWISVCNKVLCLTLFLIISLFVGLFIEHLYLLKVQGIMKNSSLDQKNNKQNTSNFISINSVLVLPYEQKHEEEAMGLDKNLKNYSVLANVQMQLETDSYEVLGQVRDQKQYNKRYDGRYFI